MLLQFVVQILYHFSELQGFSRRFSRIDLIEHQTCVVVAARVRENLGFMSV